MINFSHYRKAVGALLVYDVTKKSSFLNVQKWLFELRQYAEPDCSILLVGNKVDLVDKNMQQREVFNEEVKPFIEENKLLYYETSALSNEKVNEAFEELLTGIIIILMLRDIQYEAEISFYCHCGSSWVQWLGAE